MRHNVQLRVPSALTPRRPDDSEYLRWRVRELEASERRHRALIEQSADVTALVAPNGTILYQSPSTSHILGYGPHELAGRSLFEYVHPQDAALTSRTWSLIVQMPGRSQPLSFRYRHKDGAWRVMEGIGTNRVHEPEVEAIVVNIHDVTTAQESTDRLLARNRHLQQQADDLRELNRAVQIVGEAASADELHRVLAERALAVTHADATVLLMRDPDDGTPRCVYPQHVGGTIPELAPALPHPVVDCVISEAKAVVISDTALDGSSDELLEHLGGMDVRTLIAVPIMRVDAVAGVLACLCAEPRATTRNDQHNLTALAGAAAVALANMRLVETERAQRRLAETLREAGALLAQSLDGEAALDLAIREMPMLISSDAASIMLLDGNELRCVRQCGRESGEHASGENFGVDLEAVPGLARVIHDRESIAIGDVQAENGWDAPGAWRTLRSFLAVPICTPESVIGCLCAGCLEPNRLHAADAERLRSLADQLAVALHNAQKYTQAEQTASEAKAVAHRMAEAQEKERRRIAREIHDEAGQSLTSILVQLKMLESAEQPFEQLRQQADQARRQVADVLDNLHQLATRLRPPALDHLGLVASLRQQAVQFKRQYGLEVNFEVVGLADERFAAEIETAVYRFVQEALTNVARHAGAHRVDIILERRDTPEAGSELVAIVEDDGCGFDVEPAKRAGRLGLLGMEERVTALGGRVLIESQPGAGATLFAQIPCPAHIREPDAAALTGAANAASMQERETVSQ